MSDGDRDGSASTVRLVSGEVAARLAGAPGLGVGTVLAGRYRIDRFIARGGMGAVYAAHDRELGVPVAVKTIRPDLAWSPEVIDRFKREIQLARTVTHPSVCRIFDLGRHGEGDGAQVFLTMELLDGESLADRVRRGALPPAEARPILDQIVAGLAAAHDAGVVHRDLKPHNVLLVARGAVITDFGLAREVEAAAAEIESAAAGDAAVTTVVGTPDYMAPEQLRGELAGAATDVFALGVLMHEVLTGRLPHAAAHTIEDALARAAVPSQPSPDLPAPWAAVIARCLAPSPRDRFASAREVTAALSPPRRGARRLAIVAAVVLAAGGAAAVYAVRAARPAAAPPTSVPHGAAARRAYADGVARLRDGDEAAAAARLREVIAAEPSFPLAHAELAGALIALGDVESARAEAERASALSRHLDREHALVVEARLDEADGRWDRAAERYDELLRLAPGDAEYLLRRAYALITSGDLRASAAALADLHAHHVTHPRVDYLEAFAASRAGDWKALLAATRRAAAAADRVGARRMAAQSWVEQGNALMYLGDLDGARAALDEADRRVGAAGDRAGQARVLYQRALILTRDDRAAASAVLGRALALYRTTEDRDGEAMTLSALAQYAPPDRLHDALDWYQQALDIYVGAGATSNRDTTLFNVASIHYALGESAKFHAVLDEVLAGGRQAGVRATVAEAAANLAIVAVAEADPARGQLLLDEASHAAADLGDVTLDAYLHWIAGELALDRADVATATRELTAAFALADDAVDVAPVEQARCAIGRLAGDPETPCLAASQHLEAVGKGDDAVATAWYALDGDLDHHRLVAARALLPRIASLAAASQDRHTALDARLAAAEVAGDRAAMAAVAADAAAIDFHQLAFAARFAAARAAPDRATAERELAALADDATARGMTALARRCQAARPR